MRKLNDKIVITFAVLSLTLSYAVNAAEPSKIEISTQQTSIRLGEPLIIKLTYTFEKPPISPLTNQVAEKVVHSAHFWILCPDDNDLAPRPPYPILSPSHLTLEGTQGLEYIYSTHFVIWMNFWKNKPTFEQPGVYTIQVDGWREVSNLLHVMVLPPSKLDKRGLSLLSDPNDSFFLVVGSGYTENRAERMSHLKQVVELCGDTLLARWAAARLGLEFFNEFHKRNPSFKKFKEKREKEGLKEPFFDDACKYLDIAYTLPDGFPIREKVLWRLVDLEIIKGDYQKALSHADELGKKHPRGRYGRRASKRKEVILNLQRRELEQSKKDK